MCMILSIESVMQIFWLTSTSGSFFPLQENMKVAEKNIAVITTAIFIFKYNFLDLIQVYDIGTNSIIKVFNGMDETIVLLY